MSQLKSEYDLKNTLMVISDYEFKLLSDLIYEKFGIHLTEAKRSLLVRRLQAWLRQQGFKTFKHYYDFLVKEGGDHSFSELANRITTNYTFFYREPDHFDFFYKTVIPELEAFHQVDKDLRIWCAASASGEEPYMLVMMLKDYFGVDYNRWQADILATDISRRALEKALEGRYNEDQTTELPRRLKHTYLKKADKGHLRIVDEVKDQVTFRRFNLINKVYPFKKPFDVIFCRNVMIYFDDATKSHVIEMLYRSLRVGGYLFVGHSESISRRHQGLKYVLPAVYQKVV